MSMVEERRKCSRIQSSLQHLNLLIFSFSFPFLSKCPWKETLKYRIAVQLQHAVQLNLLVIATVILNFFFLNNNIYSSPDPVIIFFFWVTSVFWPTDFYFYFWVKTDLFIYFGVFKMVLLFLSAMIFYFYDSYYSLRFILLVLCSILECPKIWSCFKSQWK